MVVAKSMEKKLGVAGDRREQIVEVVRDSACQLTDRLDLLRLDQVVGEKSALCDVEHDSLQPVRFVVVSREEDRVVTYPDDSLFPRQQPVLE